MRVFVTGGTGLLGNCIIRSLVDRGDQVLALVREQPSGDVFHDLPIEFVRGDLADQNALESAIANCDAVIHSAGLIHIGWKRRTESIAVNATGSRLVAQICRQKAVPLVHVGTVNTLAIGAVNQATDETTPLDANGGQVHSVYVDSKRAGVNAVLAEVRRGLSATIVHPGFMLGPWDWKPSSGRMMVEVQKAWRPLAPSGGCSLCDVRDVANGVLLALKGTGTTLPNGREYVLAGHNWTYLRLWTEMAHRVGRRPPLKTVGWVPRKLGGLFGDAVSNFSSQESDLNTAAIAMSSQFHYHDSSRAINELGYQIRPAEVTLDDAHRWLQRFFR